MPNARARFAAFRDAAHADPALCARLAGLPAEGFADAAAAIAVERGHDVTPADLETAVRDGREAWLLRWIV